MREKIEMVSVKTLDGEHLTDCSEILIEDLCRAMVRSGIISALLELRFNDKSVKKLIMGNRDLLMDILRSKNIDPVYFEDFTRDVRDEIFLLFENGSYVSFKP